MITPAHSQHHVFIGRPPAIHTPCLQVLPIRPSLAGGRPRIPTQIRGRPQHRPSRLRLPTLRQL